ncbi:MAG: hypothetical protein A2W09_09110 [Deltaproteobacteria bacterium RBG_16_50_11]|nr:MAG: hypothetical protein A2W09_09110 [Deltaproteobacteria bacterium RBG_16_50_11]
MELKGSLFTTETRSAQRKAFCLSGDTDRQKRVYSCSDNLRPKPEGPSGESVVNPEPYVVRGISRFSINHIPLCDLPACRQAGVSRASPHLLRTSGR